MKALDDLNDFTLLLIEENGSWYLRIKYEIVLSDSNESKIHERYLMSYRNKKKHWKILDNALAFIQAEKRLCAYRSLKVCFKSGLYLTTKEGTELCRKAL